MRALHCRPAQRAVLHGVIGQSSEMAGTRWSACRKPAACTLVSRACTRCCCCCWRLVSAHTLDNWHACADDVMTNQPHCDNARWHDELKSFYPASPLYKTIKCRIIVSTLITRAQGHRGQAATYFLGITKKQYRGRLLH
jgi:hypothetical protein